MHALHERVLLVSVLTSEELHVQDEARVDIHDLPTGPHPGDPALRIHGGSVRPQRACVTRKSRQNSAAETCLRFRITSAKRNAERSAAYFCIPAAQAIEIRIEIEI
jgi:hypothetical protein